MKEEKEEKEEYNFEIEMGTNIRLDDNPLRLLSDNIFDHYFNPLIDVSYFNINLEINNKELDDEFNKLNKDHIDKLIWNNNTKKDDD